MFVWPKYAPTLWVLVAALLLSQCRVKGKLPSQEALQAPQSISWDTMQLVGAVSLKDSKQTQKFKAKFRTNGGNQLWGQFTKFGFEGGRLLLDKDSLKALNRLDRTYYSGPITGLDALGIPVLSDYDLMMSWVLGKTLLEENLIKSDTFWHSPAGSKINILAKDSVCLTKIEVYEPTWGYWVQLSWSDFSDIQGNQWAAQRSLAIKENGWEVNLSTNALEFKGPYDLSFDVPSTYEFIEP